jgi:cystine transport system substrate-binding protein
MHRRTLLAALASLSAVPAAASLSAAPALAATALDQVRARGVLRIATTGANKPYTFVGPDAQLRGYDIDWARLIAEGLGVKPEFIRLDWRGILPGLIAHQFDCAMSAVRITPERAAAFDFSAPYGVDDVTVAVLDSNTRVHGVADLHGLTVATATGSVQEQFAREQAGAGAIHSLPGLPEVMMSLRNGQADAAVVGRGGAAAFIKETGAPIRLVGSYQAGDLAAVFPKNSPELVAAVNAIIAARRADGTYDTIRQRWFGDV